MLVRRDGSKVSIDDTVAPIRDAQGTLVGAVMVFRDVEARRTAAAQREADKRKDEFLATLAHELRNPLAPIDQAALILESATATDEQRRWSSEVIRRQVRNMSVLLDDLLDVARITHGTLMLRAEPTLLSDIVDAAIETARPSIDASRHDLTIDLPNESPVLDVDGLRLAQVLSNLLINAARYTSPGGRVSVSAHCSDDSISVTVSDTGIGFTSREQRPGLRLARGAPAQVRVLDHVLRLGGRAEHAIRHPLQVAAVLLEHCLVVGVGHHLRRSWHGPARPPGARPPRRRAAAGRRGHVPGRI
jgi:signal transduction histidine kinase